MDIANLFPIARELVIKDAHGNDTDIKFNVVGLESKAARDAAKRVHKSNQGRTEVDLDALERGDAEVVASCVTGWSGLTEKGNPIPYSHAKAVELLIQPECTFIKEQVEAFVSKRAEFFRKGDQAA